MFGINIKFLKRKTAIQAKKTNHRENIGLDQANKIGIIFYQSDREKFETISSFVKQLEKEGKEVSVLCFLPAGKENFDFKFDFFTIEEMNFWGSITSEKANSFIKNPFDYLFCLDIEPHFMVDHVLAYSAANCRVGAFQEKREPFFELMLKVEEFRNLSKLIESINHYTRQFKTSSAMAKPMA